MLHRRHEDVQPAAGAARRRARCARCRRPTRRARRQVALDVARLGVCARRRRRRRGGAPGGAARGGVATPGRGARQRRRAARTDRTRSIVARSLSRDPRQASRAAGDSPSASRRGSGTGARRAGTTGRSPSAGRSASDRGRRERQHVADDAARAPARRRARAARAPPCSSSSRLERVDVDRQPPLAPEVVPDVLVAGDDASPARRRAARPAPSMKRSRVVVAVAVVASSRRRSSASSCQIGSPSRAPVAAERPARQRLAGIPLALAVVQQAARREAVAAGAGAASPASWRLRGPERRGVPLVAVRVVDRHERRLAAHRQPHVAASQSARRPSWPSASIARPLLVGVRLGDARRLVDARAPSSSCANSTSHSSTAPLTGAALAGSGVQASGMWPSPASRPDVGSSPIQPAPGQVDLGPGVQVGEVRRRRRTGRRAASRRA